MHFQVTKTEIVFDGKAIRVRVDEGLDARGRSRRIELIEHIGSVVMVPIDDQGQIHFVRQYRHPVAVRLLELPAGTLEHGEDPEQCAVRECREEIGMLPARLTHMATCFLAPGYSSERAHFYLAQDLSPNPLTMEADEDIDLELITLEEARTRLMRGDWLDAKTVVGLSLAFSHLGKVQAA
ncbi:MAG TPA: NUDIX hydrolase [Anaerolineae bacterium]|nr:NUDIX hydrolase [Anaerolineae bacterium]